MTDRNATPTAEHELVLTRLLDASAEKLYRCWTEPALLKQWFVPKPYTISSVELDLRPGGASNIVMRSPEGRDIPNPGVYLEIVPNRKLVFSDAFGPGWVPAGQPFMVAQVTFEPEGTKTRYIAHARHWTAEAKAQHEAMGFHQGWSTCADQLEALAKTL
ncbi:MAG: putative glutathione S-transferase-related transrane protein [Myxococcaceae bacterium]|nr:putative glutathione S-transferase-related transrane protein [Myxococcaceae bacterium]